VLFIESICRVKLPGGGRYKFLTIVYLAISLFGETTIATIFSFVSSYRVKSLTKLSAGNELTVSWTFRS
jgi:hypothetical protein